MKRVFCLLALTGVLAGVAWGQMTTAEDIVAFGSYGIADPDQAFDVPETGAFTTLKNGYSVNANLNFSVTVPFLYSLTTKLNAKSRVGSPYVPLQLVSAKADTYAVTVDTLYGKIFVFDVLEWGDPLDLNLQFGKSQNSAAHVQKVSGYGLESVTSMLKTSNTLQAGAELVYKFAPEATTVVPVNSSVSWQVFSAATADEGVARLYDTDGSQSEHGKPVLGEYAPQIWSSLKLTEYDLGFGRVSAEAVYAMNAAGIYSGNSFGAGVKVSPVLIPETLFLSLGGGLAWYEKNLDAIAAATGTDIADKTVDLRETLRAGLGAGVKFVIPFELTVDVNVAAAYSQVNHIYRDPLTLIGASIDTKVVFWDLWFVGAGVVAPTLTEAVWQTKSGVSSIQDDFVKTFTPGENYGFEVYTGLNLGTKSNLVLGVNNNRGLAMNYGLESVKDGEYKVRQKDSSAADKLYETFAVYLKTTIKM